MNSHTLQGKQPVLTTGSPAKSSKTSFLHSSTPWPTQRASTSSFLILFKPIQSVFVPHTAITSWQVMGKQWKQWLILFWGAPKSLQMVIAAMKLRRLLLGSKVMTNLDIILKSRDITLPTKVCLVKAMVFPVVMYGCESWTVKKAEHWRIDAFELWCWKDSWESLGLLGDPASSS